MLILIIKKFLKEIMKNGLYFQDRKNVELKI